MSARAQCTVQEGRGLRAQRAGSRRLAVLVFPLCAKSTSVRKGEGKTRFAGSICPAGRLALPAATGCGWGCRRAQQGVRVVVGGGMDPTSRAGDEAAVAAAERRAAEQAQAGSRLAEAARGLPTVDLSADAVARVRQFRALVRLQRVGSEEHRVVCTETGNEYAITGSLRDSLFGSVYKAVKLSLGPDGASRVYTEEEVAIKQSDIVRAAPRRRARAAPHPRPAPGAPRRSASVAASPPRASRCPRTRCWSWRACRRWRSRTRTRTSCACRSW